MAPELEKQLDSESSINQDAIVIRQNASNSEAVSGSGPRPKSESTLVAEDVPGAAVEDAPEAEPEYVKGFQLVSVMAVVCIASFTMLLDTSIIATAIPKITSEFHSLPDVGWYGSSYLLANSAIQPLTGRFYTQFSSKWTFLVFIVIFEIGSLIAGVAQSSTMLIVGRAVSGMGSGGIMNGGLTIISSNVPNQKRATYLGIMMAIAQMGILCGPIIGGSLTEYATWRWCFYINLPIGGFVVAVLTIVRIPTTKTKAPVKLNWRNAVDILDLVGFVIFAPTVIMFLLALEWGGNSYAWNSSTVIGLFCGSGGMLVILLWWEHKKGDGAMFPFNMIKQRIMWSACCVTFLFAGSLMTSSYYLAIWFQAVKGYTPMMSGVYTLPQILTQMVGAISSGILVSRWGYYLPWAVLSAVLTSIAMGLFTTFSPTSAVGIWVGFQIIAGYGRGCGMQMSIVAVQNNITPSQVPVGTTLLIFGQNFGGAIWLSVAETVFAHGLSSGLHQYLPSMSAKQIIALGATEFRHALPESVISEVVKAYNVGTQDAFYLATGLSIGYFAFTWGLGWKSVKKVKKPTDAETGVASTPEVPAVAAEEEKTAEDVKA